MLSMNRFLQFHLDFKQEWVEYSSLHSKRRRFHISPPPSTLTGTIPNMKLFKQNIKRNFICLFSHGNESRREFMKSGLRRLQWLCESLVVSSVGTKKVFPNLQPTVSAGLIFEVSE